MPVEQTGYSRLALTRQELQERRQILSAHNLTGQGSMKQMQVFGR